MIEDKITPILSQGVVQNLVLELGLLYDRIKDSNGFEDGEICGKVLFSVLNGLSKDKLWDMTDYDLLQHIGKIQIVESK